MAKRRLTIPRDGLFKLTWSSTWFLYRKDGWWYETFDGEEWVETPKMVKASSVAPATKLEFLLVTGHEFVVP